MAEVTRIEGEKGNVYYESRMFVNNPLPITLHYVDTGTSVYKHYAHKHKELEIIMGLSGKGTVYSDMKPISSVAGEAVIANPNRIHYVTTDDSYSYYCLIVDTEFLSSIGIEPEEICFEEKVTDPYLYELFTRLHSEWSSSNDYRSILIKSYVTEILVLLCRDHLVKQTMSDRESKTLKKIKLSINYIKSNFRRDLTLEEVSEVASLSRYHYCREFKKATGLTPIEFINRTRCEYAKELLEARKYTIAEISEMCGFATAAHFSKTFKNFFDSYPSEFVRKLKNEPAAGEMLI